MKKEQEQRARQLVQNNCAPMDQGGHVAWNGRLTSGGRPMVQVGDRKISAARIIFTDRTGREPVGRVQTECQVPNCMAPNHLSDEAERRHVRAQERALYGLEDQPWDICPKGRHSWLIHGRFEPDRHPYCNACHSERKVAYRAAGKAAR